MNPKSYKDFKEELADEVGIHKSVVDDLVTFYFSKVRQSLSNLEDNRVYVEGLGTFSIRKARLEKAIVKNKSFLGNLEKHTYKGYSKSIDTQKKITKLQNMLNKVEDTIRRKKEFKNNKL